MWKLNVMINNTCIQILEGQSDLNIMLNETSKKYNVSILYKTTVTYSIVYEDILHRSLFQMVNH